MDAVVRTPGELWTVWWNHQYDNPSSAIGLITAAAETSEGLVVAGRLAIDSNPKAMTIYERLLGGTLREFSIGFGIVESRYGEWNGQSMRFLDEIELLEISVVWKGAAIGTRTIEVRSAPAAAAPPESELDGINARLDAVASNERPGSPELARQIEDLILATRLELVQEALDRAKQVAWEGRMDINTVLDPVPVRVDARMRPVTS